MEIVLYLLVVLMVLSVIGAMLHCCNEGELRSRTAFAWSLFLGFCASSATAFFILVASNALAPGTLLVGILALGIPLGLLHFIVERLISRPSVRCLEPTLSQADLVLPDTPAVATKRVLPRDVVPRACCLLIAIALVTLVVECTFPPVSKTYYGFRSGIHTKYARRGLEPVGWKDMKIDWSVLATECTLVGGAFLAGLSPLRRPWKEFPSLTACRMSARAALILHASVWLLPLFEVGADTISFAEIPIVGILLIPNLLSMISTIRYGFSDPLDDVALSRVHRQLALDISLSVIWCCLLLVSLAGFSYGAGATLGALACLLSAHAGWQLKQYRMTTSEAGPRT